MRKTKITSDFCILNVSFIELFEGDMVMGAHLRRAIEGTNSKRSAVKDSTYKWPGGSIPYELDKSLGKMLFVLLNYMAQSF